MICTGPGTCVPECELWSLCHCGCGERTKLPKQGYKKRAWVRGHYHRYVAYHGTGEGYRCLTPVEKGSVSYAELAGMVEAVVFATGTQFAAAERIGVHAGTISSYRNGHRPYVRADAARLIQRAFDGLDRRLRRIQVPMSELRDFFALRDLSPRGVWPDNRLYQRYFYRPTQSVIVADEMAVSAGFHPGEIWADWFEMEAA